jgi:hypothetical protein
MVTTKRSTARTALFATASLVLAARGADAAAINFAGSGAADDAFASGAALDCADLWFHVASGALVPDATGAGGGATYAQGYAVNEGTTVPPVDFGDCKVAAGYYMQTDVTSVSDGDRLTIKPAPDKHFATGGVVLDAAVNANIWDGTAANLVFATDARVTKCPGNTNTNSATGSVSMAACITDAGYYVSAGGGVTGTAGTVTAAPANHFAAGGIAVDTITANEIWDGTAGALAAATGAGVTKCPDNTNTNSATNSVNMAACITDAGYYVSAGGGTAGTAGTVTAAPANHFAAGGIAVDTITANEIWDGTAGALAAATGAGVTKCPDNSNSPAGSNRLSQCVTDAGYYLKVGSDTATSVVIKQAPANWYSQGGADVTNDDKDTNVDPANLASANSNSVNDIQACPFAGTSAAGSSARTDCTPDCITTNSDSGAVALAGTCFCPAGTYSSTNGQPTPASGGEAAANGCTKCSDTYSSADATMITSAFASNHCVVKAGYIITSGGAAAAAAITVAPAPAGTFQRTATPLSGNGAEDTVPETCPANSNSVAGSAFCTCDDGYIPALGGEGCQPFANAASAAAGSQAAESAGASTPIAVALAAAAAVPLLL